MMRCLVIAVLVGALGTAHADRGYVLTESWGPVGYHGGLRAYGSVGKRLQISFERRSGDRTIGFVFGGTHEFPTTETWAGNLFHVGLDIKRRWPLSSTQHSRIGVQAAVRAGPRLVWGQETLTGYSGVGASGGALVEADIGVFGFYLDAGADVLYMTMPVDAVAGVVTSLSFGMKMGWL